MCCRVRAIDEYGGMVISRGNVIKYCLVRAIDEYGAMVE
jgi:hypothetical protein